MPSKAQVYKLVGKVFGAAAKATMENHFYTIDSQIWKQRKGGTIGSDDNGKLARLYMMTWDKKFFKKLKVLGIAMSLYSRYVDDILMVLPHIQKH